MSRVHHRQRFLKGLFTALRVLFSYKIANIFGFFMSPEARAAYRKKLHRENAVLIREKALEMKGIMIKVGQFLSSRVDLLPDEYTSELSQLQDRVPPHPYAEIKIQISEALGRPPEEIFSFFDETPIAAASLGQVHRATLKGGIPVAVKVQYPGIEQIIETDIRMFGVVIRLMEGKHGGINLKKIMAEFSRIIKVELDYIEEGRSADRFRKNFSDDERVVIPEVKWDYTRTKVLTLEYVEGIKITDCDCVRKSGVDCRKVVDLLAETYAKMIFINGFFHGDPHPGNIFVSEDAAGEPRLIFVDFGMVQEIPGTARRELRKFAHSIVERDTTGVLESIRRLGFIAEGADHDALMEATEYLFGKYRDIRPRDLKTITIGDISSDIEHVIGVFEFVQIPNNFILLGRTISMLNGIAYSLNPESNMIEIATPYMKEFLKGDDQAEYLLQSLKMKISAIWDLPSQLNDFLIKTSRGDLSVKLAKSEMEELTGRFKTMTNVLMLVVITVTASTAALFLALMGNIQMATIAGGASAVFGLLSVFRLMRE